MDERTVTTLVSLAAFLGLVHTLAGPDHYVPFIAMSRAGRWTLARTLIVTALCGVGHVAGSILIGGLGIGLGVAAGRLEWLERFRGGLAGWLLLGFGLAYAAWGLRRAFRNRPHTHWHTHADGTVHTHEHVHVGGHTHVHPDAAQARSLTPWVLFTLFVFGPCEPLIPMLMIPAAQLSAWGVALVATTFGAVTIATMIGAVFLGRVCATRIRVPGLERFSHAVAGLAMAVCGALIQFGF